MNVPAEHASQANRSVLAVDDEPLVLSALQRELESAQYQVISAPSAEDALDLARQREFALVRACPPNRLESGAPWRPG